MQFMDNGYLINFRENYINLPVQSPGRKVGQMRIGEETRVGNPRSQSFCKHQNSHQVHLKSKMKSITDTKINFSMST